MYPRKLAVSVMKTAGSEGLAFQKWKWSERKKSFKSSWKLGGHLSGLPPSGLGIFTASDLKEAVKKKWQKIVNVFHLIARVQRTRVSPQTDTPSWPLRVRFFTPFRRWLSIRQIHLSANVTVIWASHSQKPSDMGILCNPNPNTNPDP